MSSTRLPHRGKGLPEMSEFSKSLEHGGLSIWSQNAGVTYNAQQEDEKRHRVAESLPGTLVLWSIPFPVRSKNMQTQMISIRNNFSENPSGRYVTDGPNSGERFRDEWLLPALRNGVVVTVNLDGALGYGSSFLEEAFGGLVRAGFKYADLRAKLEIQSKLTVYKNRVWRYIQEESQRQHGA
jgi:hypothetical protein